MLSICTLSPAPNYKREALPVSLLYIRFLKVTYLDGADKPKSIALVSDVFYHTDDRYYNRLLGSDISIPQPLHKMPALIEPSLVQSQATSENISRDYDVTRNGFLPSKAPLKKLADPYYSSWEFVARTLPDLLKLRLLRHVIDGCQILSTDKLQTEEEWRRAYVVLVFLAHGYIWGGEAPSEVSTF